MSRIVAIGDVHGAIKALRAILRGTRLIDSADRWIGTTAHLVQIGDIFNRGTEARQVFELLLHLKPQAEQACGAVTTLTGNHDVMMATGNEAWSSEEEYLAFASTRDRESWRRRAHRQLTRQYRAEIDEQQHIDPLPQRISAWRVRNVPGRRELRRALGPRGRVGRAIRRQPIAILLGDAVFVHGGISPEWAAGGVDSLNTQASEAWGLYDRSADRDLLRKGALGHMQGPLWYRSYAHSRDTATGRELTAALSVLGARRMISGHSPTDTMPGGRRGAVHTRFRTRYVGVDVRMRDHDPTTWTALVIDAKGGHEWRHRQGRGRLLWKAH